MASIWWCGIGLCRIGYETATRCRNGVNGVEVGITEELGNSR